MVKDNSSDYTMADEVEGKGDMKFVLLRFGLMNESSYIIWHTEGRRRRSKAHATEVPKSQRVAEV
ncbi:hypothetical protein [Prevotella melaninogenica]|uniref:Uncharacterized protein n=1 Tax=Prevotella melaninogenica TaxID=28132 RepID=A0A7D4KHA2_9BACT|nr:hypothetical protein [Prevotella melaninogenica]QKH88121.1 hypothetical protein FIU21_03950 [Prevotella melaninogenica]